MIDLQGYVEGMIEGGGGSGSTVEITPTLTSGTKVADYSIDGEENSLYAPTPVEYTAGQNVTIEDNEISATDTKYTAGTGISIDDGVINCTISPYGENPPINFDFTKHIFDINHFISPTSSTKGISNGLSFNSSSDYFEIDKYLYDKNMVYEIDIASLSIQDTTRQNVLFRFVSDNLNGGLAYHYQTQKWGVWDRTTGCQDSDISDKDYFNNSTVKIIIDGLGKWHIYKDDVLVFEPTTALETTTTSFGLGSPTACINNITINSFKIYPYVSE